MKKEKLFFFLKISPLLVLFIFIIWFFLFRVIYVQKEYKIDFNPAQITKIVREYPLEENIFWHSDTYSLMKENENTFILEIPSVDYKKLDLEIKYKNPDQQDIFKIKVLDNNDNYAEDDLQIFNPVFEKLSPSFWDRSEEGEIIFWQRLPKKYDDFKNFLNNLPSLNRVLTYNYSLAQGPKFISEEAKTFSQSIGLVGSYSLFTYLKEGEELNFNFTTQNINKKFELSDVIDIVIYNQNEEEIYKDKINEPFYKKISNKPSEEMINAIKLSGQKSGVYKIAFTASNNILTKNISSQQQWLAFNSPLTLSEVSSETKLINFNSSYITFTSSDHSGLQTIKANDEEIEIAKNKEEYFVKNIAPSLDNPLIVTIPKGNLKIATDGYISFSKENAFLPKEEARKWDEIFGQDMINLSDYNYLIMNKKEPVEKDNWLYAKTELDLSELNTSSGLLKLRFIAPNLKEKEKKMYLSDMRLVLIRKSFSWAELSSDIVNFLKKIRKRIWNLRAS